MIQTSPTRWQYRHRRGDQLIWASGIGDVDIDTRSAAYRELVSDQPWTPNALADEGEQDILEVYFQAATAPTNFYIGLVNDTPVDTDTLATLAGEPSGNGYARQLVERSGTGWPTEGLDGGDYQITSSTETFTASGGSIGPVTYAFLTTVLSGTTGLFLVYNALTTSRTLADGESLDVSMDIKAA